MAPREGSVVRKPVLRNIICWEKWLLRIGTNNASGTTTSAVSNKGCEVARAIKRRHRRQEEKGERESGEEGNEGGRSDQE